MIRDPLRDAQDEEAVAKDFREHEIYQDETTYIWEGKELCVDCFQDAVRLLLEENPRQIALEMGIEMVRYE